ncbi:MAG: DUF5696 domain-containing protein [Oscillospiraceae bacterium]
MHSRIRKLIVCALVVTMLAPLGSLSAFSDDATTTATTGTTDATGDETGEATAETGNGLPAKITDAQAVAACKEAMKNDQFIVYVDEENDRVGLFVIATGKYWWSTPINALADDTIIDKADNEPMNDERRERLLSNVVITYQSMKEKGEPDTLYSGSKATVSYKISTNQITATYKFKKGSAQIADIPLVYTLDATGLTVSVDTANIVEKNNSTVDGYRLLEVSITPNFGAAPTTDIAGNPVEGYMVVPDGSGAIINYNNGKGHYQPYIQQLYGKDLTPVPATAPAVTKQAYLPVCATVSGNDGLVMIATDGDSFASIQANVSGDKTEKQSYNKVGYTFEVRSTDKYFMAGAGTEGLNVIEKGDIKTDRIAVKFCPVSNDAGVNVADVAQLYRNYLISTVGLTDKAEANKTSFYLDLYGGVLKQTSVLGIPFDLKTSMTSFSQSDEIIKMLKDSGISNIVTNLNDWTDNAIDQNISTKAEASDELGGEDDFSALINKYAGSDVTIYPSLSNLTMAGSTWGYFTFSKTAVRISNSFSRQPEFSLNYKRALTGVTPALLTPTAYAKVFSQMIDSFSGNDLENIGFGGFSDTLSSDFSKKHSSSRDETMATIIKGYQDAQASKKSIIADEANAYILPYVDHITNVPVYSSNFDIEDASVPLYQMVVHGYIPYSTTAINASSNSSELFMLAIASGSGLHYDMIYEDAAKIKDTDYNKLFFANYKGWINTASAEYNAASEVLSKVSDMVITRYEIDPTTGVITTTYTSKDGAENVTIKVDQTKQSIDVDGVPYDVSGIIGEGGLQG